VWQHWLTICIPDNLTQPIARMYMDGPRNTPEPETELYPAIYLLCDDKSEALTVYLQQIPNEDLSFPDQPAGLGEDALIAYGWRKFLNETISGGTADPAWLLRLPMTRAGSNAMTAVQDYMRRFHADLCSPWALWLPVRASGAGRRGRWRPWIRAWWPLCPL
jgi:PhoPQ-activated pathogenicity-related protein